MKTSHHVHLALRNPPHINSYTTPNLIVLLPPVTSLSFRLLPPVTQLGRPDFVVPGDNAGGGGPRGHTHLHRPEPQDTERRAVYLHQAASALWVLEAHLVSLIVFFFFSLYYFFYYYWVNFERIEIYVLCVCVYTCILLCGIDSKYWYSFPSWRMCVVEHAT